MQHASEALGAAIRARRDACETKLSQAELGKAAGYGAGAGVAISRIESGQMRPSGAKLKGIAKALGTTSEVLVEEARRLASEADTPPLSESTEDTATLSLKERLQRVQQAAVSRTETVTQLGERFNAAHDRARDEFFMTFIDQAVQIKDAPAPPEPRGLSKEEQADAAVRAEYRRFSSGVVAAVLGGVGGAAAGAAAGGAAAYATYTAAAMFGTASTGAAIPGLSGVAATNATLALLGGGPLAAGGAGVKGGTMLLRSIVAAPAALLAVGGLVWMAHRTKQKQADFREKLEAAEAELVATQDGFDALVEALAQATAVLDYISIHAAHALDRWTARLGTLPLEWSEMREAQRDAYKDFLTIAGCQLTVWASLNVVNVGAFMSLRDEDLAEHIESVQQDLGHAKKTVEALV
jgi:transcriptional regulator with XRE-family HTH domain